MVEQDTSNI